MPTYIAIIDFTEQGIRTVQESPARVARFQELATRLGATVKNVYWTSGGHDGVVVVEAPDDKVASTLFLSLGEAGNVRTQTLRAFDPAEFAEILGTLP